MRVIAAAVLAVLVASFASPQTVKDALELNREAVESQRRVLVAGSLHLTDAEAQAFWPLYDGWEKDRREVDERTNQLVADFVAAGSGMSDTQATAMLSEALRLDDERLRVRRTWLSRMSKAIPPRKLVLYFQLVNKLDAIVRADVARQIPLNR
ncbi:MAG TPA: hypothetical protein VEQ10_09300 [Vicinamibacteria bacterium]|nr:hypothetical protein [Vicinamibacteria bacterium]